MGNENKSSEDTIQTQQTQIKLAALNRVFDYAYKYPDAGAIYKLRNIIDQIHRNEFQEADKDLIELINGRKK